MAKTYLQLVNAAIVESGTELDELSSGSFASTTDSMEIKWKRWVQQAWLDIQTERRGWEFMRKEGMYILKPRMKFYDGTAETETAFNNEAIEDSNTNWGATVNGNVVIESGTFALGTAAGYFNFKDEDDTYPIQDRVKPSDLVYKEGDSADVDLRYELIFNVFDNSRDAGSFATTFAAGRTIYIEGLPDTYATVVSNSQPGGNFAIVVNFASATLRDEFINAVGLNDLLQIGSDVDGHTPTGVQPDGDPSDYLTEFLSSDEVLLPTMRIMGYGQYSLSDGTDAADSVLTDIQEVDLKSFQISPYVGDAAVDYSKRGYSPLTYIPYNEWNWRKDYTGGPGYGNPSSFTITHNGKYEFNRTPNMEYAVKFVYWKKPETLTLHGDTVTGIEDFYTEAIVWKAIMYWADYDNNMQAMNRARNRFSAVYRKLLRDYSDEMKFSPAIGRYNGW